MLFILPKAKPEAIKDAISLSSVERNFFTSPRGSLTTYFSSEKEGVIKGIEAVREHHRGFGFVNGGKSSDNKLWVEDLYTTDFDSAVVVTGIWRFRRATGQEQRGPLTFVYVKRGEEYRLAHLNFGNYADKA